MKGQAGIPTAAGMGWLQLRGGPGMITGENQPAGAVS